LDFRVAKWFHLPFFNPVVLPAKSLDTALIITILTTAAVFVFATLYSNAGNGGSTGYAATLLLFGMSIGALRPTALALNILVAIVAAIRSYRSGFFRWQLFWPLAVGSFPVAFLTAYVGVKRFTYMAVLAAVMLYAAVRLFFNLGMASEKKPRAFPIWIAVPTGAAVGLVSGVAGIGGGILLTPMLLLAPFARTNDAVGVAGPFVLINSIIIFAFTNWETPLLINNMAYWAPAALIGAWVGTEMDMRFIPMAPLSKLLSLLVLAGALKLISSII
jgi:uncharacterized protein